MTPDGPGRRSPVSCGDGPSGGAASGCRRRLVGMLCEQRGRARAGAAREPCRAEQLALIRETVRRGQGAARQAAHLAGCRARRPAAGGAGGGRQGRAAPRPVLRLRGPRRARRGGAARGAGPRAVRGGAGPGARGRREGGCLVGGFLVERLAESDYGGPLAALAQVVSPEPVLSPELLALARAVADRYAGSLADVLQLAVPPRSARAEAEPLTRAAAPPQAPEPGTWTRYRRAPPSSDALATRRRPARRVAGAAGPEWADALARAVAADARLGPRRAGRGPGRPRRGAGRRGPDGAARRGAARAC